MDSRISQEKRPVRSTLSWEQSSVPTSTRNLKPLGVKYIQADNLPETLSSDTAHQLAVIGYGHGQLPSLLGQGLSVEVNLPALIQPPLVEVWESPTPVLRDQIEGIRLAFTDDVVFGCLEIKEQTGSLLEDVARDAYAQIFNYCTQSGFSHLLRMWNYFPGINIDQIGLERYKRFCVGRHQAFSAHQKEFASTLPAASAVGTSDGPFQVLFLAGKHPGNPLENPRQISAYEYPSLYGPKSPSFARAMLYSTGGRGSQLFVAGTASIVGHATRHQEDPAEQTVETLSNIHAILNRAQHEGHESWGIEYSEGLMKVFVRHEKDLSAVCGVLKDHILGKASIHYVLGEMCREDLLVEIEGMWNVSILPNS